MFDKIVWATDGSQHADRALEYARQLAKSDGASLHVIHIIEKFAGSRAAGQDQHADEPELDDKINRQAAQLRDENGIETHVHMYGTAGSVAKRIAEISSDAGAEVIVVGTRGHSAVTGALLGSVTQQLLHVAHCPVLAVPPLGQTPRDADQPQRLTVAASNKVRS
jgi:nucleotide-binding universal stress UspA family protein